MPLLITPIGTSTETVESAPLNTAQTPTATVDGDGQPQSEIDAQYIADDPDAQREEAKQCATWQDFVAYEQQNPKTPDLALPVPPARFSNGCITEDATGSALNIFITENSYDNGIPMAETPDEDLLFGFIPSVITGRDNQTDDSSGRPERMHIGFSSRISRPETTEGYYEVQESSDGSVSYQYIFSYALDVPSWELVEMLEPVKAEWDIGNY